MAGYGTSPDGARERRSALKFFFCITSSFQGILPTLGFKKVRSGCRLRDSIRPVHSLRCLRTRQNWYRKKCSRFEACSTGFSASWRREKSRKIIATIWSVSSVLQKAACDRPAIRFSPHKLRLLLRIYPGHGVMSPIGTFRTC
jgi:hypothetical protein